MKYCAPQARALNRQCLSASLAQRGGSRTARCNLCVAAITGTAIHNAVYNACISPKPGDFLSRINEQITVTCRVISGNVL